MEFDQSIGKAALIKLAEDLDASPDDVLVPHQSKPSGKTMMCSDPACEGHELEDDGAGQRCGFCGKSTAPEDDLVCNNGACKAVGKRIMSPFTRCRTCGRSPRTCENEDCEEGSLLEPDGYCRSCEQTPGVPSSSPQKPSASDRSDSEDDSDSTPALDPWDEEMKSLLPRPRPRTSLS